MKYSFKKSEYVLAGVLALVAAFPVVTDVSMLGSDLSVTASLLSSKAIKEQAKDNQIDYRQNRRDFQKARALCQELQSQGKEVNCPNINDADDLRVFLATHENAVEAVEGTGAALTVSDLNTFQLNLLRRYKNIHSCPKALNDVLPGFYALCQANVKPASRLQQKLIERKVIKGPQTNSTTDDPTLEDFLKVNKGVKRTW
jgi:hypothetical protein